MAVQLQEFILNGFPLVIFRHGQHMHPKRALSFHYEGPWGYMFGFQPLVAAVVAAPNLAATAVARK